MTNPQSALALLAIFTTITQGLAWTAKPYARFGSKVAMSCFCGAVSAFIYLATKNQSEPPDPHTLFKVWIQCCTVVADEPMFRPIPLKEFPTKANCLAVAKEFTSHMATGIPASFNARIESRRCARGNIETAHNPADRWPDGHQGPEVTQ